MPKMSVLHAVLVGAVLFSSVSQGQIAGYDKELTRERILRYLENPPTARLEFVGEPADDKARAFLDFYRDKVDPRFEAYSNLMYRYKALILLRDTASQKSPEEFERWTKMFLDAQAEDSRWSVDSEWTATLKEWARLADGLEGKLPDFARQQAHDRELEAFAPEMEATLNRIAELETQYEDVLREVPAVKGLPESSEKKIAARIAFKTGKITFEEGQKMMRELDSRVGPAFVGFEAAERAGDRLNEIAILRTKLAQSKGFRTWTDYVLEVSGQGYTPEYRGADNQRRWLREYLKAMKPVQEFYLQSRLKDLGLEAKRGDFRMQDLGFITAPGREMLQPYFPKEHITRMWEKTLVESGFRAETLAQIVVDDEFRDGKNRNGAYQMTVDAPHNEVSRLDARRLEFMPITRTRPELKDGFAYILQSWAGRGLEDLRTAFHEGGHATERLLKFKDDAAPEGYGYVEVPSLMSEYFLDDPDVVLKLAEPVDGKKPTREEIVKLLANADNTDLVNLVYGLKGSLFDMELWAIDYTDPGAPTFLEAVKKIDAEVDELAPLAPAFDGPVPFFWHSLSTTHYTSGSVRNIGYDYARLGAHMMAEFISDELQKKTGRRNWFEQPEFAKIYEHRFVSQGWRKPFPANIEWITGRKFDYMNAVNDFARQIGMPPTCGSGLDKPPKS